MAIKEEFEIRISKEGELKVVAKGFRGAECEVPLKKIQKILNAETARIEHTEEFSKITGEVEAKIKKK